MSVEGVCEAFVDAKSSSEVNRQIRRRGGYPDRYTFGAVNNAGVDLESLSVNELLALSAAALAEVQRREQSRHALSPERPRRRLLRRQLTASPEPAPVAPGPDVPPPAPPIDWTWLASEAMGEFQRWRVEKGATHASASSYASGARAYVRYCRAKDRHPLTSVEVFHEHLLATDELSFGTISDYRSHARAFVEYLRSTRKLTEPA